jgi:uridine kinase
MCRHADLTSLMAVTLSIRTNLCSADYDFDSPNAFDHEELVKCMQDLQVASAASACAMRSCSTAMCSCTEIRCSAACPHAQVLAARALRIAAPADPSFHVLRCRCTVQAMRAVEVPEYDFMRHQRSARTQRVEPADVVIIEGILVLHEPLVCGMLNMKIFVDTDDDVRLARRWHRRCPSSIVNL